jgi:hypothetical protein
MSPGYAILLSIAQCFSLTKPLDVENVAEFLSYRGYESDPRNQVILRDDSDPRSPYFPNGCVARVLWVCAWANVGCDRHNILAAIDWLVSEPGYACTKNAVEGRVY